MEIKIDKIEDLDDGSCNITFSADQQTISALAAFGIKQSIIQAVKDVSHTHLSVEDKYDLTKEALVDIFNNLSGNISELQVIAAKVLDKVDPIVKE